MKPITRSWPPHRSQKERVDFVHPTDEIRPPTSKRGSAGGTQGRLLGGRGTGLVGSRALRLALRAFSPHDVRIPSIVKEQMSPGLRDLCDHSSHKLQGLDTLCSSGWGFGVVLRSFCEIQDLGVVSRPSHPGEAHGSSQHTTGNVLYRPLLSGWHTNGVVDAKTTSPPG